VVYRPGVGVRLAGRVHLPRAKTDEFSGSVFWLGEWVVCFKLQHSFPYAPAAPAIRADR
jgi:hypothetical protein